MIEIVISYQSQFDIKVEENYLEVSYKNSHIVCPIISNFVFVKRSCMAVGLFLQHKIWLFNCKYHRYSYLPGKQTKRKRQILWQVILSASITKRTTSCHQIIYWSFLTSKTK